VRQHRYYDRDGVPISMEQWVFAMGKDRHVGFTNLGRNGHVSTVWLGLNHAFGEGPPLIFETMIFGGPLDEYQERYSTEEEARVGHEFAVLAVTLLTGVKQKPLIHNGRKPRR